MTALVEARSAHWLTEPLPDDAATIVATWWRKRQTREQMRQLIDLATAALRDLGPAATDTAAQIAAETTLRHHTRPWWRRWWGR